MRQSKLQTAFALIGDFKRGQIKPGTSIGEEQIELLRLLCEDLLSKESIEIDRLPALIEEIARVDSHWNRKVQLAIDEFYVLRESGKAVQAEERRRIFLEECPSSWYRGIVEAL